MYICTVAVLYIMLRLQCHYYFLGSGYGFPYFFFQAVDRLNIKVKNFRDLLTDELFTRKDIITIQVQALFG